MAPPTSERALLNILRERGPLRPSDLVALTGRSERAVRYQLRRLEHAGLASWRLDLRDPRNRLYFPVADDAPDRAAT